LTPTPILWFPNKSVHEKTKNNTKLKKQESTEAGKWKNQNCDLISVFFPRKDQFLIAFWNVRK